MESFPECNDNPTSTPSSSAQPGLQEVPVRVPVQVPSTRSSGNDDGHKRREDEDTTIGIVKDKVVSTATQQNDPATDKGEDSKDDTMVMEDTLGTEKTEIIMDGTCTSSVTNNQPQETKHEITQAEAIKTLTQQKQEPTPKEKLSIPSSTTKEKKENPAKPNFDGEKLGGEIKKEAFALLAGQYEDAKENSWKIINVPLTNLPAILGRSQKTTDEHIFDLGNCRALSRQHAAIFYTDSFGGKLGKYKEEVEGEKNHKVDDNWRYIPPHRNRVLKPEDVIRPSGIDLPKSGFYAIECMSKNKLFVDRKRVDQGKIALLQHGSTIRMAGYYYLYFILPENDSPAKVISVPHPVHDRNIDRDDDDEINSPPCKKSRRDIQELIEGKTISEMIEEFIHAVDTDIFERKHSLISAHILYQAVQEVASDSDLQELSSRENGVARSEIIDWIDNNEMYTDWVQKMLTKLEMKSYQANLSKALIKAGFTRIGTTGRHVKWLLPPKHMVSSGDEPKTKNIMFKDIDDESKDKDKQSKVDVSDNDS